MDQRDTLSSDAQLGQESFELSLHNFLNWLEVLTMERKELCEVWGNYNVAWELVSDLETDGRAAVTSPYGYLTEEQKQGVRAFLDSLSDIPKELLISATSVAENEKAMSDARWVPYKSSASALLDILAPAVAKNPGRLE